MEDLRIEDSPHLHRYAPVAGTEELLSAVVAEVGRRTSMDIGREQVLIGAGATGALGAIVGALVDPGDEVLLVAPHWPLIAGIVRSFRGRPISVPILGQVATGDEAVAALERQLTAKTVAVYWNTPNNPSGRLLPHDWLGSLAEWAAKRKLWILADEVYEHYAYRLEHTYTLPLAPGRTFAVHSFSKAYGMAGYRCGYAIGPAVAMAEVRKVSTHTFYSAPTPSQVAATRVLADRGRRWISDAREAYRKVGNESARRLEIEPPEGGTFLFIDVADRLDATGLAGFLDRCAERGLLLAPGPSFGPFPTHVRVCFTAVAPEVTLAGVDVLADLLGRG
jgi:N-succinyldiaminopimelate aminotransferase